MFQSLDFDWFLLLLRVLFIFLLYFFLYQVVRVTTRELVALATASSPQTQPTVPATGRLVVVDGGESDLLPGTAFTLATTTIVGRHPDCTLELNEPFVSAEHAELANDNGRWWVRDLGSTNGTFVNGNAVRVPTGVKPGDIVQFGRVKLQLVP